MGNHLQQLLSEETWDPEGGERSRDLINMKGRDSVLSSSTGLVVMFKQTVQTCMELSKNVPMLEIARILSKYLDQYTHAITDKLPG